MQFAPLLEWILNEMMRSNTYKFKQ